VCARLYMYVHTARRYLRSRAHGHTPKDNTVTSHMRLMLFLCRRRRRRRWRWRRRCWYNDVTLSAPYAHIYTPTRVARYTAKSLGSPLRALLRLEKFFSGIRGKSELFHILRVECENRRYYFLNSIFISSRVFMFIN